MWSDRLPERRRKRLVERLQALLPAPRPHSRGARTPLRVTGDPRRRGGPFPSPDAVAEEIRTLPGFAWLDGKGGAHRLYARPLAVLSAKNGKATVTGPGGKETFKAGGFELLEAAFTAWGGRGGTAGATLAGYLGYELAGELEELPLPPSTI